MFTSLLDCSLGLFSKCLCHCLCLCICICYYLFVGQVMSQHSDEMSKWSQMVKDLSVKVFSECV